MAGGRQSADTASSCPCGHWPYSAPILAKRFGVYCSAPQGRTLFFPRLHDASSCRLYGYQGSLVEVSSDIQAKKHGVLGSRMLGCVERT